MEIQNIIEMLANGINPLTGEVFDTSVFGEKDTYVSFRKLKAVVIEEHKKMSRKGSYRRLCEEYPEHIIIVKMGLFYSAFNESAEILGQIMDYKVSYMSGHTPITGGPDLCVIAEKLQAAKLSYIVFNNNEIEDKYDGKNPFI